MGNSCSCYCGIATKSNQYKWITSALLMVIGTICLITFARIAASCASPAYLECRVAHPEDQECKEVVEDYFKCLMKRSPAIATFELLWILCWVGASIPLYMMCCCTQKPQFVAVEGGGVMYAEALGDSPDESAAALLGTPSYTGDGKTSAAAPDEQ